ncbi:MAG: Rpn family recombination-promoting nuclease/putative transposase [Treponema sp.]|jgi:hypothetical protein|nr:Rpn family recombination-promoting nuclease/putative transposase [Treponema sp.]
MQHEHDKGFKDLLSNRRVFGVLLSSFIGEAWMSRIDPETLELVSASFIIPTFEKREADIIYKLEGWRCIHHCGVSICGYIKM